MNILIACEESQTVCKAFREKGHNAFSCDIQECSGGHPEWHIQGDVLEILNPHQISNSFYGIVFRTVDGEAHSIKGKWDMIIAHPPCTHLAVSGARHFNKKREDGRQREGIEFFCQFLKADCDKIVVENPVNIISGEYILEHFPDCCAEYNLPIQPSQRIHPWMFGDNFSKNTCLWIKGLPNLIPEVTDEPELEYITWIDKKTGKTKRQNKWYYEAFINCKSNEERSKLRSKTFNGIARAMAEQWG